jgi:hypothetical protein
MWTSGSQNVVCRPVGVRDAWPGSSPRYFCLPAVRYYVTSRDVSCRNVLGLPSGEK